MKIQPLKIGTKTAKVPVIQGGMGVGISLGNLAGAVAKEGGIGIISAAQPGFREEDFIKDLFEEDESDYVEIQRNELAQHFNCVPSQINYVISTRFKPSQGYYVESKRGGGGNIKIKKINNTKSDYIMHIINNIGKTITVNDIDILLSDFLTYNIITQQEAKLLKVATSDNVLRLNSEIKDEVRARIFKNMLLNIE